MNTTLEQIEGEVWPEPDVHTTLIDTCHRLRRVPIESLTAADVRMLLGQGIGVRHLIARAIDFLERDPLIDASFFPGDLLIAALRADANRFRGFPHTHCRLKKIAERARVAMSELDDTPASLRELPALLNEYLG